MRYRPLGNTGIQVSEVGFGTWGLGGDKGGAVAYGPAQDEDSKKALRFAFERGVTFYDTAALYGFGHSEKLLGEVFENRRADVVIASKVGFLDFVGKQDFSPDHLRQSLDESLERLRSSYLDLYQLHSPPIELLSQDRKILETLLSLHQEKKIRALGISVRSPDEGLLAADFPFQAIQVNFNLTDQRALENGFFQKCIVKKIGVIVRTPLSFGFLSGAVSSGETFSGSDHRNRFSPEQRTRWAEAIPLFRQTLGPAEGETPSQSALRFCLSFEAVSSAIPGMLLDSHVEENTRASELPRISPERLQTLAELYRSNFNEKIGIAKK